MKEDLPGVTVTPPDALPGGEDWRMPSLDSR